MISLKNIQDLQKNESLIAKRKIRGNNSRPHYILVEPLKIKLSNGFVIDIPKGFKWDLSTTPRFLWALFPPDGDYELAYLIHDYLWIHKKDLATHFGFLQIDFNRKFTDDEMLKWAKATNGTKKISYRNFDNWTRYIGVRAFGWLVWYDLIKLRK